MDRLALYNDALRICGERKLASLTENREPRRLLDDVWSEGGISGVLEQGQWNFAMRAVLVDYDPAIAPSFGYRRGFSKPSDWIRTCAFCSDEYFSVPHMQYVDEPDYWYADLDTIYVKYVSNDATFGADMNRWPQSFAQYAAAYFADQIVLKLTSDKDRVAIVKREAKLRKRDALAKDAMNQPSQMPAATSWVKSRAGVSLSRRDGGSRSNLIG